MDRGSIMSEEERLELVNWVKLNLDSLLVIVGNRRHHTFIQNADDPQTSRQIVNQTLPVYSDDLPKCIFKIKERIIEKENIQECMQEPMFQDFIGVILPGGFIHKHKDFNIDNLIHCRYNVFLELPIKGGETYYDGNLIDSKERHYVLSRSGLDLHWSTPVEEGMRITISFGFMIPHEQLFPSFTSSL